MSQTAELAEVKEQCQELMGEAGELEEFFGFVESAESPDALDAKTKELMSLAIGVAIRCEDCILWHIDGALEAGASHDEVLDALKVAVVMGGGPAMMFAVKGYEMLEALEEEKQPATP
jgi:AhpD family alkylhydroperoxidase